MKNPSNKKTSRPLFVPSDRKPKRCRFRGPPTTRNWLDLPPEVTANILHRTGGINILESAQKVCTTWRKICKDPSMWRIIDIRNLGEFLDLPYDLEKMCMHAVDRSEGQLIDITVDSFCTNELVDYIVDRSSKLRRLRIECCYGGVYEVLDKAFKKMPFLEELHLIFTDISKEAIKDAGRFCPRLKTFKLNTRWYKLPDLDDSYTDDYDRDNEAIAIGKSMPQLQHLQFIGNQITDKGLKAILDGCSRLELLDLRLCNNLKLEGSLGKRCSEQIKYLKRPNDYTKKVCPHSDDDDDADDDDAIAFEDDDDNYDYSNDYYYDDDDDDDEEEEEDEDEDDDVEDEDDDDDDDDDDGDGDGDGDSDGDGDGGCFDDDIWQLKGEDLYDCYGERWWF